MGEVTGIPTGTSLSPIIQTNMQNLLLLLRKVYPVNVLQCSSSDVLVPPTPAAPEPAIPIGKEGTTPTAEPTVPKLDKSPSLVTKGLPLNPSFFGVYTYMCV